MKERVYPRKIIRGIRVKGFHPIYRNRDEKGNILTYSVFKPGYPEMEFNTIHQAKLFALKD